MADVAIEEEHRIDSLRALVVAVIITVDKEPVWVALLHRLDEFRPASQEQYILFREFDISKEFLIRGLILSLIDFLYPLMTHFHLFQR